MAGILFLFSEMDPEVRGLKGATPISYREGHIWVRTLGLRALEAVRNGSYYGSLRRDGTLSP